MPVNPTYPGLYIEELPSTSHAIVAAPTSITVFIGYSHPFMGEVASITRPRWNEAIRIFNFTDYERYFGGLFRSQFIDTSLPYAVYQFFLNGGTDAYVVGLQPQYFDAGTPTNATAITPASISFSGITFTAKDLTDVTNITITIGNVRTTTANNDTADLFITHGSHVEAYRGVRTTDADPAPLMNPLDTAYFPDFIGNRLAGSALVSVAAQTAGRYLRTFTGATRDMDPMPASPYASTTTRRARDYQTVLQTNTSLDKVDIFNILCMPGFYDAGVWADAMGFCHDKRAFLLLDPPANVTADGSSAVESIDDFATGGSVPVGYPNAALYFPYLRSMDPILGDELHLPPSGYVAGLYARTDLNRGVWKAPAGLETTLLNTIGVVPEGKMTDLQQGVVNPHGVNVLRTFPNGSTVIWGARTTVTNNLSFEQWKYVPVRRTALFIEQTLLRNLGWVVFEPNDEPLWSAIRLSVENFMLSLFRQSAFQGKSPNDAFLVRCDSTTTTQTDIDLGIVNILVGFRPLKPAEFVIIKIAQLAGQVQS
jgi:phage tail sheath protein FI